MTKSNIQFVKSHICESKLSVEISGAADLYFRAFLALFIGDHPLEYHIRSYQSAKLNPEQAHARVQHLMHGKILHWDVCQLCCTHNVAVCCTLMCFNLISLMGHPYIVRLFWIVIHTFLVEPLFFLESLSEIIFLEKGWSKNLKTFLSPFILYFTTNKKLNSNQNGTLFYIILMLYYLYIKTILISSSFNIINYNNLSVPRSIFWKKNDHFWS